MRHRYIYDNSVPSKNSDILEGQTTKTYYLLRDNEVCTVAVKFCYGKCRAPFLMDEDIVYSPNKYRETEGTKVMQQKVLYVSQCLNLGMTITLLTKSKTKQRNCYTKKSLPTGNLTSCGTSIRSLRRNIGRMRRKLTGAPCALSILI